MGLSVDVNGRVGRLAQRLASHPRTAPVTARVMPHIDRAVSRVSGGRFLVSQLLVPSLMLTTTGAKSGQLRTSPLATLPDGEDFIVVGSNFGGGKHPGWSANLLATPQATVVFRGRTMDVDAHLLSEQDKQQVWPRLRQVWPAYDDYVARSGRDLRVFRLSPRRS